MTEVISTEELARRIGKPLEEVEAMIAEAEAGIDPKTVDWSTLVVHGDPDVIRERLHRHVEAATRD